jgi:hypothetical protein
VVLMTPQPQQEYIFGYYQRNKYKDLVFYLKTGEHSNYGLFEMPDTPENRAIMDTLKSRPAHPTAPEGYTPVQMGEISKICKLCTFELDCKAHDTTIRNQTLDDAITQCEWDHPITQEDVWRKLESLRTPTQEQP